MVMVIVTFFLVFFHNARDLYSVKMIVKNVFKK